jgi:DDE superfamily endonuclease
MLNCLAPAKYNRCGKEKKTVRRSFSIALKLAIIERAKAIGFKPAERECQVDRKTLKRWVMAEEKLRSLSSTRGVIPTQHVRLLGSGRPPLINKATEDELCEWFENMRSLLTIEGPIKISVPMCVAKVRMIDANLRNVARSVLRRRLWRIFRRRNYTDRAITHHAQQLRNCTEMIEGWAVYITKLMAMLGITHDNLCNFDETNVFFSPDSKRTLAVKGDKWVAAAKAESSQRCTAMLGVSGTGYKFPPYIIYKGRDTDGGIINRGLKQVRAAHLRQPNLDEHRGFPTSNFYAVQDKAWMNSCLMVDWATEVFAPWAETKVGPTILILDEFSGHLTGAVRDAIIASGAFVVYIPGGYTWRLQVMDVGINKPFKDKVRDAYDDWYMAGNFQNKPQRQDVASWIKASYDAITMATINNSWRKVGLPVPTNVEEMEVTLDNDGGDANDGTGLDFLGFEAFSISESNEEEAEADAHYNDDIETNNNDDSNELLDGSIYR